MSFTVQAINPDGTIDTAYTGNVTFGVNNVTDPGAYTFQASDQGQRTFSVTIVNPNARGGLAANFPASVNGANLSVSGPSGTNVSFGNQGDHLIVGGAGNDAFSGNNGNDLFLVQQGGNETVNGGGGDDGVYFGAAYTSDDIVNGGAGALDQIGLQGNYASALLGSITGVELIVLLRGNDTRFGDVAGNFYDYGFTLADANVAAGATLAFQANALRAGEDFTLDASAETDGNLLTYGGFGVETITGGAGDDGFFFGNGRFGAGDSIDGGMGSDQLALQGNFNITFGAGQMTNIEYLVLISASDNRFGAGGGTVSYTIATNNANVAVGQTLVVSGNTLQLGETFAFNGSAETDGRFDIYSGAGNDVLTGGAGDDLIFGGGSGDTLTGGGGNDVFGYSALTDSNSAERDGIQDFALGDRMDLTRLDANDALAGDQDFDFIATAGFSGAAGQLRYENISGGGPIYLVQGDTDGDTISDMEIVLVITDGHQLTRADFIGVNPDLSQSVIRSATDSYFEKPYDSDASFMTGYQAHGVAASYDYLC